MSETDAFFTHTIVGAPMSVLLGRQVRPGRHVVPEGLLVDLTQGQAVLSPAWQSWGITTQACAPVGIPRMRPTRARRWLERHALVIAGTGLFCAMATAIYWGVSLWL
jgi:hypothetical protein